jgi:hypothetical protein
MIWELYEVWAIEEDGHEDLIMTTKSLSEARKVAASKIKQEGIIAIDIFRETEDGELEAIESYEPE